MKPILFDRIDEPGLNTLEVYQRRGGYDMLRRALTMSPEDVLAQIMESGIRGRGGAGFQMGRKICSCPMATWPSTWCATPTSPSRARSRTASSCRSPRTRSSRGSPSPPTPAGINEPFIYIRGEYQLQADILEAAIAEAADAGLVGERILGSGVHSMSLVLHRGAGAYICGEETGLLDSLEGKRGNPRLKPPFPAIEGLYARPNPHQQRRDARHRARTSCGWAATSTPSSAPRPRPAPSSSRSPAT